MQENSLNSIKSIGTFIQRRNFMSVKVNNFKKTHAINSWLNLIFSVGIVACVFVAVVINLLASPNEFVE